jgi:hypothetical protein
MQQEPRWKSNIDWRRVVVLKPIFWCQFLRFTVSFQKITKELGGVCRPQLAQRFRTQTPVLIRTYAEEENCEAIFRQSGSEFIILRIPRTENGTFFGQKNHMIGG